MVAQAMTEETKAAAPEKADKATQAKKKTPAKKETPARKGSKSEEAPQPEEVAQGEQATEAKAGGDDDTVDGEEKRVLPPETLERARWYAVHTYSGYEKRARLALIDRAKKKKLYDLLVDVMIPEEQVVEVRKGERHTSTRKLFPGYLLVNMVLTDETWHLVKDTPKVTGFIGGDPRNPCPVPESEVLQVTAQIEEGRKSPKPIQRFEEGDQVRVIDGPFQNFAGTVEEVNADKAKVRVLVSIFGRATPIELDFVQVESTG
jgi:transcriptional antiterminator NusG